MTENFIFPASIIAEKNLPEMLAFPAILLKLRN